MAGSLSVAREERSEQVSFRRVGRYAVRFDYRAFESVDSFGISAFFLFLSYGW